MASPAKKDRPKAPAIEGVSVIEPDTLKGTDFARFRNDDLYFIDFVLYYPQPTASDQPDRKPLHRVLALTPYALFITDLDGTMDRATRYEDVSEIYHQKKVTKKLFGSESIHHVIMKVPREVDCHFAFDVSKDDSKSKLLLDVVGKIWTHKLSEIDSAMNELRALQEPGFEKPQSKKKKLPLVEVEPGADIKTKLSVDAAKDYVPPEEIKRRNREQLLMMERTEQATAEAANLQKQIEDARAVCMQRQHELKEMEAKYGVDLSQLRAQKQLLQQRQLAMHKQITNGEIELVKMQADVARLREQLDEERSNYDQIVQKRISSAGDNVSQKQHEMMQLRQKAQQKEIAKAQAKSQSLKEALAIRPRYEGSAALTTRAQELEARIEEAVAKWSQEMDSTNKIEKFLEAINAEITRVSSLIVEANEEKATLLGKRDSLSKSISGSSPQAAGKESAFLEDDDLIGGNPPAAPPAASKGNIDIEDDLFGSPTKSAPHPATSNPVGTPPPAGGADLDDLLDDTPPTQPAVTSQPPAIDMDLF